MRIRSSVFSFFAPANLSRLGRPLLWVWLIYLLSRLIFVATYWQNFNRLSLGDWFDFILLSFRYDASAILSINLVFLPLLILRVRNRLFLQCLKVVFVAANSLFLIINAIDIPFFAFNARRTSWDALLFLLPEFLRQLPQFLLHYWPVPFFSAGLIWFLWRSWPKKDYYTPQSWWKSSLAFLFWLAIGILLIRNSLKLKPLVPGEAFTLSQAEAGHGILNTPFLLFKTVDLKPIEYVAWIPTREMDQIMAIPTQPENTPIAPGKGQNLVIIILESFATEYTGLEGNKTSFTPFLDSLARVGTHFPHHFANGRTSRDALPSLFASIPSWMEESFVTSQYVSARLDALGHRLSRAGYQTAFFHGGKNGTMSFDVFSKQAGFQEYVGLNEYPVSGDFDGHWGIFDGPFLQFFGQKIGKMKAPFASVVFTLSSHQPYTIPEKFKGRFPKGPLPVHEAIGYTDFALKEFFQTASRQPWFRNTLFVITADHTQESVDPRYQNLMASFDVPLILYHPGQKIQADTSQWLQHLDLLPSLTDYFGLKPERQNPLGQSFFWSKTLAPMQYQDGWYYGFFPQGTIGWRGESLELDWNGQPEVPSVSKRQMAASLQWFRRGLLRDSLFVK